MKFLIAMVIWTIVVIWPAAAVWGYIAANLDVPPLPFALSLMWGIAALVLMPWLVRSRWPNLFTD